MNHIFNIRCHRSWGKKNELQILETALYITYTIRIIQLYNRLYTKLSFWRQHYCESRGLYICLLNDCTSQSRSAMALHTWPSDEGHEWSSGGCRGDGIHGDMSAVSSRYPTSCCSVAEIMSVLFFHTMKYRPEDPRYINNDRFILSKVRRRPPLSSPLEASGAENGRMDL